MNELTNDMCLTALSAAEALDIRGGEDFAPRYDEDGNVIGTCTDVVLGPIIKFPVPINPFGY